MDRQVLVALFVATLLCSCATVDYNYSEDDASVFVEQIVGEPDIPDVDLLALSPELTATLDANINRRWSGPFKIHRVRELLFGERFHNIQYSATRTLSAADTFAAGEGNCLSMTSLFIAAARYVGVDAHYETVEVRPSWDHADATVVRYEHIIAAGDYLTGEYVMDFLPDFVDSDFESVRITDAEARGLYFNNLGAEALLDGDNEAALANLRYALSLRPNMTDAWNNMGAAQRRAGNAELAEFSYLHALSLDSMHSSALSNLAQFYRHEGRQENAKSFMRRVIQYRRRNPYFHYYLAQEFYVAGRYEETVDLLNEAVRLKRDEPDFYLALASTYDRLGESREQARMLAMAERYSDGTGEVPAVMMNSRLMLDE